MTRRILLTGGTGFVGRQVLASLAGTNARIHAIIRTGSEDRLPAIPAIERVITTTDLFAESADWWGAVCRDIDTVIHVAWYAETGKYLQSERNLDCLEGTLRLAKGATQAGARRFVGIGTCFEYDLTEEILSIDTPLRPLTPYAGAKAAAFQALSHWLPAQGVSFTWCRLFYLYGEGENEQRLVPYLRARLAAGQPAELTSGKQIRDYLDSREAGRMIVDVALSDRQGAVNICSGRPVTVRQLAEQIADEFGYRNLLRFGARPDNLTDPLCVVGLPNWQTEATACNPEGDFS